MKFHKWTEEDDTALLKSIDDCKAIFEHFETQGKTYSEMNAWDAVAGRLLPGICVTGAACRRRVEVIHEREEQKAQAEKVDEWAAAIDLSAKYERDLQETMFDGISEMLGNADALFERLGKIEKAILEIRDLWK